MSNATVREPVGRLMATISRKFLADIHRNLANLDIDRSYYPLLLIDEGNGKLTQKELSRKLASNKVQVVRIVDYLSSNGYVERMQNDDDHRKTSLAVTAKAKAILPDIKRAMKETASQALKGIPEQKVEELYELLGQIDKNLSSQKSGS
ncbi:MAG TPA: MarR family transcriptional regulator [Bacteroidales bacterium]|nr:MarR family transcriptional regulator [Bacteroidales bacterium]